MDTPDINTALILILGALCSIFLAIIQMKKEIKKIWEEGIHETKEMQISSDDIRRIARTVLKEIQKFKNESDGKT